ncbi:hypothetical protein EVAR_20381_1 [Eumeta japonica]|uniref:Uncharacterized protein n=1 Tax=Eumeta variegata TaxID=151549 RepID=A0A4C1ZMH3_EUMVA|nr:hypothetical protein EVAR_20381_1 [Eumeta japonica]
MESLKGVEKPGQWDDLKLDAATSCHSPYGWSHTGTGAIYKRRHLKLEAAVNIADARDRHLWSVAATFFYSCLQYTRVGVLCPHLVVGFDRPPIAIVWGCGWESLMKSVTLGNVTMSHRTREARRMLRLSPTQL